MFNHAAEAAGGSDEWLPANRLKAVLRTMRKVCAGFAEIFGGGVLQVVEKWHVTRSGASGRAFPSRAWERANWRRTVGGLGQPAPRIVGGFTQMCRYAVGWIPLSRANQPAMLARRASAMVAWRSINQLQSRRTPR